MSQNKAFSTPFILAVLCIYFSYFLHGISVITLAQNMTSLAEKFSTDNAGIAYLISGIGLGRLISILFFGVISDKFGRRAVILMAVIMYLLFFFGIPACPNLTLAYCLAVCVGIANSALDTGGYPALMECFPKASGSAVILVKAMVSFGQMFYPMLVSYMLLNNIWYGYGLIIPGILFVLITLMLLKSKFPSQLVDASVANELPQMNSKPLVWLEGVSSVLFGVAAFSTFYVIVVWMPKYAMAFAGMSEAEAYELKVAAMVHDIGKLKLSEYLYGRTNESLPEEEKKYMSMHSKISYDVLKKYDYSDNIMEVVLSHHECYDGSGYPNGLVGEDIPIGARILKVTDEFAALISDRPYRKAFDIDTAVSIMIDEVKNLDMKAFILFQRLIHEETTLELIKNSRIDIDDLDISDILDI